MKKRCIYSYIFKDNSVYIGLTCNINQRNKRHLYDINSSVNKHIKICPYYKLIQETDYIEEEIAKEKEKEFLNKYKNKKYNILNKIGTGSLGSRMIKWTYEKCKEEALKYKYKKDFMEKAPGAYDRSYKNKWLDEICSHMNCGYLKYSKVECKKLALNCKSRKEFEIKYNKEYKSSCYNGWLDEICSHLKRKNKYDRNHWTYDECKKEALKYKSRYELQKNGNGCYRSAYKNGWLDEICSHMTLTKRGHWTIENCKKEALKYKNRSELYKNSSGCYHAAYRNNWLDILYPKI